MLAEAPSERVRGMIEPRLSEIREYDSHRLIPSKYRDGGASVLERIADDDRHLQTLFDLDHATNDRLLGENHRLPGINERELVFEVPCYRVVNAAFCHPNPRGGRFNGPQRGAWYAAFELETSLAEVIFHKTVELVEVDWLTETVTYDDYLADFSGQFHDLRLSPGLRDKALREVSLPDPWSAELDPQSYRSSQALAAALLAEGSVGVVYPSVRHPAGTCLACFRPAVVANVRRGPTYSLSWRGSETPSVHRLPAS